ASQPACTVLAPCRSGDECSARRSARSEDVVAQKHPQQNQHSDRNAHQVQDEVADPAALVVVPIHVSSLLRRRCAATRREGGEHAVCEESVTRTGPNGWRGCGSSVHRWVACRYSPEPGCSTGTKQGTPPGGGRTPTSRPSLRPSDGRHDVDDVSGSLAAAGAPWRNLRALLPGLRNADRDRLLAAGHLASAP